MIHHNWSALCQNASIDVETNTLSLLNILEGITINGNISEEKRAFIRFELVSLWNREPEATPCKGSTRIHFIDPQGNELRPILIEMDLSNSINHRTRVAFSKMAIPCEGTYTCIVEFQNQGEDEWHQVADLPLRIKIIPIQEKD